MLNKMITKIKVSNFKSYKYINLNLESFNILIGSNASGKSNLISFFKFLRDYTNYNLDNTISMNGGIEFIRNKKLKNKKEIYIEIHMKLKNIYPLELKSKNENFLLFQANKIIYKFSILFSNKNPTKYRVSEEQINEKGDFFNAFINDKNKIEKKIKLGKGEILISKNDNGTTIDFPHLPKNININKNSFPFLKLNNKSDTLLINNKFLDFYFGEFINEFFSNIFILDVDPKVCKNASPITGKIELEEDGSNLPIVLEKIIQDQEKKVKFQNIVKDIIPFLEDIKIQKSFDKKMLFEIKEIYSKKSFIPSPFISDGTINIICLIIALFFQEKDLIIIEEPERNIHPYLLSKIIELFQQASNRKQIIITTHNPEIIKYADKDNIFLIKRDDKGFSSIQKASNKKEIYEFLKNQIGIEELFVQNLL